MAATRREKPVNTFWFGNQKITTKVYMMAPVDTPEISIDQARKLMNSINTIKSARKNRNDATILRISILLNEN